MFTKLTNFLVINTLPSFDDVFLSEQGGEHLNAVRNELILHVTYFQSIFFPIPYCPKKNVNIDFQIRSNMGTVHLNLRVHPWFL